MEDWHATKKNRAKHVAKSPPMVASSLAMAYTSQILCIVAVTSLGIGAAPAQAANLATPTTQAGASIVLRPLAGTDATRLSDPAFRGKVLLVANTASQCGYTPQYAGLEALYKKYKDQGLVVLGFPSNDFGGQEPDDDKAIQKFVKDTYGVDFPMFSKGPVLGAQAQPLYAWLVASAPTHEPVAWNFEKFLLDRDHKVVARFKSSVAPDSLELTQAIEAALHKL